MFRNAISGIEMGSSNVKMGLEVPPKSQQASPRRRTSIQVGWEGEISPLSPQTKRSSRSWDYGLSLHSPRSEERQGRRKVKASQTSQVTRTGGRGTLHYFEMTKSEIEEIIIGSVKAVIFPCSDEAKNVEEDDTLLLQCRTSSLLVKCMVTARKIGLTCKELVKEGGHQLFSSSVTNLEEAVATCKSKSYTVQTSIQQLGAVCWTIRVVPPRAHDIIVQEPYFSFIKSGDKTTEGRVDYGKYREIQAGDILNFRTPDDPLNCVVRRVVKLTKYLSFTELLIQESLGNCLPGEESLRNGVNTYHGFPNYEAMAAKHGTLAIGLDEV